MSAWTDAVAALSPRRWYRLGESSGTTAVDAGSDALNGTYTTTGSALTYGTAGLVASDADTAITIAGGTTEAVHLTIPDTDIFDATNHWTIIVWVQHTPDTIFRRIYQYVANPGSGNAGIRLISHDSNLLLAQRVIAGTTDEAAGATLSSAPHMLAVTYDAAWLKLYVDGTEAAAIPSTGSMAAIATVMDVGAEPSSFSPFGGVLDEFIIIATDLTVGQIGALRDAALSTSSDPMGMSGFFGL